MRVFRPLRNTLKNAKNPWKFNTSKGFVMSICELCTFIYRASKTIENKGLFKIISNFISKYRFSASIISCLRVKKYPLRPEGRRGLIRRNCIPLGTPYLPTS